MKVDDVVSLGNFSAEGPVKTNVLMSEKFNIVLVCLETNQEIPPHPEPYGVFFLVLEGEGVFTSRDGSFELGRGSAIFMEEDEIRGISCLDRMIVLGVQDGHRAA